MWLKQLKIAVVEQNVEQIDTLLENIPTLENIEDLENALYLIEEAKSIICNLQGTLEVQMNKMKKNLHYLRSTQEPRRNRLDLKS